MILNIGDTYSWIPTAFEGASGLCSFEKLKTVHGRIVYINEAPPLLYGGCGYQREESQREF